jgi:hypothetical protein
MNNYRIIHETNEAYIEGPQLIMFNLWYENKVHSVETIFWIFNFGLFLEYQ